VMAQAGILYYFLQCHASSGLPQQLSWELNIHSIIESSMSWAMEKSVFQKIVKIIESMSACT
jgi:hypothetical protein